MPRTLATPHRRLLASLLVAALTVLLSACGARAPAPPKAATAPPAPTIPAAPSTPAPATAAPKAEAPKPVEKAKLALGVNNLGIVGTFVADKMGYFKDEGVDLEFVFVSGSGAATEALVGGSVDFAISGGSGATVPHSKGSDTLAIVGLTKRLTMDLIISDKAMAKANITPDAPIDRRLAALKGMTLGITSPSAPTDVYTRIYLKRAKLDPEKDAKIVAIGGDDALRAALKAGQIDGFMLTPPTPQLAQLDGSGKVYISGSKGEVPGLDDLAYVVMSTRKSIAQKKPAVVKATARAFARGNNLVIDHTDTALEALKLHFNKVDPNVLKISLQAVVGAVPRDAGFNEKQWQTAIEIDKTAGLLKVDVAAKEGVVWTNEYVKDVRGKSK